MMYDIVYVMTRMARQMEEVSASTVCQSVFYVVMVLVFTGEQYHGACLLPVS
jgi:hypothetical protein